MRPPLIEKGPIFTSYQPLNHPVVASVQGMVDS